VRLKGRWLGLDPADKLHNGRVCQQGLPREVAIGQFFFAQGLVNEIVAGTAQPQDILLHVPPYETPLSTSVAMPHARDQVVTSQLRPPATQGTPVDRRRVMRPLPYVTPLSQAVMRP